jgi:hypothetical protein
MHLYVRDVPMVGARALLFSKLLPMCIIRPRIKIVCMNAFNETVELKFPYVSVITAKISHIK